VVELQDRVVEVVLLQDQVQHLLGPTPVVVLRDSRLQPLQTGPHNLRQDLLQARLLKGLLTVAHREDLIEKSIPIRLQVIALSIPHAKPEIRALAQIVKQALQVIEPETEMVIGQEVPQVLGQVVMAEEIPE